MKMARANPDPNPTPIVSNPEKLLRKSKDTQDQYSSSKGKSPSSEETIYDSQIPIVVPKEELVLVIDEKPIIHPSELVLPATISVNDLTVEQWRVFYELVKAEE
jgi:hypothetical protein